MNATSNACNLSFTISTTSSLAGSYFITGAGFPNGGVYYTTLRYGSGGASDGQGICYVANPIVTTTYYLYGSTISNGGQYNIQVTRLG